MDSNRRCRLCQKETKLCLSHIIPSFVFKWIKHTSATGYLKSGKNGNVRVQDGYKEYLFCHDCESLFNKYETWFANTFFHPYVNNYVDQDFNIKLGIQQISYDENLLRFAISLQWRSLLLQEEEIKNLNHKMQALISECDVNWKNYLLKKSDNTGTGFTYMVPMFNIASGEGNYIDKVHPKINFYLLRNTDLTIASNSKKLFIYTKPAVFAFFTTILPTSFKGLDACRIRKNGTYNFVVKLVNTDLTEFLFVTRPKEVMNVEVSKESQQKISKAIAKNPERALKSVSLVAKKADLLLNSKIKK